MTLTQYLSGLDCVDWELRMDGLSGAGFSVTYHVSKGQEDPHTEAIGDEVSGEGWFFRLTERRVQDDARGNRTVEQGWSDAKGVLDTIPCWLNKNLRGSARKAFADALRWGHTPLIPADAILEACAAAAAEAGYIVSFGGFTGGSARMPYMGSGETIGRVLDEVARWVPNLTLRVSGKSVSVAGGAGTVDGTAATAKVYTSPNMKVGTLTVGSTVVDLAAVYARNEAQVSPLNWYAHHAALIAAELAFCKEARVMRAGNVLYLTAREPGAEGNSITLTLTGVVPQSLAAHAALHAAEDLTQAGSLTDGENSVELEAEEGTAASGALFYEMEGQGFEIGGAEHYVTPPATEDAGSVEAWNAAIDAAGCPVRATGVTHSPDAFGWQVDIEALEPGKAGNSITLVPDAGNRTSGETLEGGEDGTRTLGDLVEAINAEDAFEFTANADGGEHAHGSAEVARAQAIAVVTVTRGGEQVARVTLGTVGYFRAAQLATMINGNATLATIITAGAEDDTLTIAAVEGGTAWNGATVRLQLGLPAAQDTTITLAGGTNGDKITLTAKEAGSGGNDLNVRADGCFGWAGAFSGGIDASSQTARIVPFSGGSGTGEVTPAGGQLGTQSSTELDTSAWCVTRRTVDESEGTRGPACIILTQNYRGIVYKIPEDASIYTPGALVYDVPFNPTGSVLTGEEQDDREKVREIVTDSNRRQEQDKDWMLVKGSPIPAGWVLGSPGVKMNVPIKDGAREIWRDFWAQFGAFRGIEELQDGYAFGQAVFFPVEASAAYPADDAPDFEEKRNLVATPLSPATREVSNTPANYKVLTPKDNMHLLIEGSFPASSKAGANVGGLKFCKGALKQYAFVSENVLQGMTKQQADEYFEGTTLYKGKLRRYTCLTVEAVFINRRRKRYQVGTNRQAASDPDYNPDKDKGNGWHRIGEEEEEEEPSAELETEDYIQAAREFWAASRDAGNAGTVEVEVSRVRNFNADATIDDVFAALELQGVQGSVSYDAAAGNLTVTSSSSQKDALGIDDFLQRIQAEKQEKWREQYKREEDERDPEPRDESLPPPSPQEVQEEKEQKSYPMVSPSISASKGVDKSGIPLNPFQIYFEDDKVFMNSGEIATPHGILYFERQEIPAKEWKPNRSYYVKAVYDREAKEWKAELKWKDRS